jgi:hypothetical protein
MLGGWTKSSIGQTADRERPRPVGLSRLVIVAPWAVLVYYPIAGHSKREQLGTNVRLLESKRSYFEKQIQVQEEERLC